MADYARIFKAYDIRGVVPDELDEHAAEAVGAAFVRLTGAPAVVTAHDMRASSPVLAAAFARGAAAQGADVIDAGLGSTDLLYYASGSLGRPGAMITASHNPARYNGIKLCRAGARPVGAETGLREIQEMVAAGIPHYDGRPGTITERDLLAGYAAYLRSPGRPVAASGRSRSSSTPATAWPGTPCPTVFDGLPIETVPLYFELDGTFPNHEANPIDPANLADLQRRPSPRPVPTSAWPSTATPTAASSSTSAARSCRRRCSPR